MAMFHRQALQLFILVSCGGAASAFTNTPRPSLFPPKSINGLQRQHCNPSLQKASASYGKHRQAVMQTNFKSKFEEDETSVNNIIINKEVTEILESNNLEKILSYLESHTSSITSLSNTQLQSIFGTIELATAESDENTVNKRTVEDANISSASSGGGIEFRVLDQVRAQMTDLYRLLREEGKLNVFGAIGRLPPSSISAMSSSEGLMYPTSGSKIIGPELLEEITNIKMINLTPQPNNLLSYGGATLAMLEGITSLYFHINFNLLVGCTLLLAFMDQVLVSGAVSDTALRLVQPELTSRITKHEAGHFLCAYLLGCPVEGVVLSTRAALADGRFGGAISAGTSYYDIDLSEQIAGTKPLTRDSIDRFSIIVMGGIAAESVEFGRADGGAGDEEALVRFLSSLNPRSGNAVSAWTPELINNQARWGATQALLLLKEYKPCYDALVDALERGGDLGQCIEAIEEAAAREGLGWLRKPLGKVLEEGDYGKWVSIDEENITKNGSSGVNTSTDVNVSNGDMSQTNGSSPMPRIRSLQPTSPEEFLKKYRDITEKK
mmetsp:Transcript_18187/g.32938  ORF Transcript_18187/g.32938 Transcript_18187/m.32938 type:complete len:552 (+) Transcript_18187:550-2205(+)